MLAVRLLRLRTSGWSPFTYTADVGPPDGCEEVWCRLSFKVAIALTDLGLRRLVCLEWRIKMLVLPTFYFAHPD